jgi:hypothetical protein
MRGVAGFEGGYAPTVQPVKVGPQQKGCGSKSRPACPRAALARTGSGPYSGSGPGHH